MIIKWVGWPFQIRLVCFSWWSILNFSQNIPGLNPIKSFIHPLQNLLQFLFVYQLNNCVKSQCNIFTTQHLLRSAFSFPWFFKGRCLCFGLKIIPTDIRRFNMALRLELAEDFFLSINLFFDNYIETKHLSKTV